MSQGVRHAVLAGAKRAVHAAFSKRGLAVERMPTRLSQEYHLVQLLSLYDVDCVLDVGANRGQFATRLRKGGYRGPIVSFEPVAETYADLEHRARLDCAWSTQQLALAERAGALQMNVAASTSVSSFLTPTEEYAASYEGGRITRTDEVAVARLDEIARELSFRRAFLKTDTQGYDLRVLEGAADCLDAIVVIQIEMSVIPIYDGMPRYLEAFRALEERGFTPSGVFPVSVDDRLRVVEFDGVFVRA